jgi:hypothetical protein
MNNTEDKTRSNDDDVKCREEEVEEWNDEKKKHYKKTDFSMGTFIFI